MSLRDVLRGWNRRRIAVRRQKRAPRPTPFGFVMNGTDDMIAGQFEPAETVLLQRLLPRVDRFVNVGANTGYYCLLARTMGRPVLALEPVSQTVQVLLQNLRANGFDAGTTVLPVAAGAAAGSGMIYGVGSGSSLLQGWANNPTSLAQVVPVVRLDDIVPPPAADEQLLILMDVEGFEYPALQGAARLLVTTPRPIWVIEIAAGGAGAAASDHVAATFALMAAAGYAAHAVDAELTPVDGPAPGVTNYLFRDAYRDLAALLAPAG